MKTLNTFSILFWLKLASAKNGKAPLYARITVNGKRAELSLKQKILIKDWDVKKNRLKGLSDDSKKVAINRHETTTQLILLSVLFQSSVTFTQTTLRITPRTNSTFESLRHPFVTPLTDINRTHLVD